MKFYTQRSGDLLGTLYKFPLFLRLLFLLTAGGILPVSAASYGQQLTLNQRNISLRQVFRAIREQSGYDVLWQQAQLDAERKINANFNKSSLSQVMAVCLSGQGLSYTLQEQSIVIRKGTEPTYSNTLIRQDSILYSGRVTDENGKPMAGATVRVKYQTRGFLTNLAGEFRLYAPAGESVLQVSYVGYGLQELPLSGTGTRRLSVQLLPASGTLSEVQVVSDGFQDIAKERATGSFEVVTAKQLEHSSDPNLLKRLEGITTGMNFNNNSQFKPTISSGSSGSINNRNRSPLADLTIRGRNTLTSSQKPFNNSGFPLLVIDGIASAYSIDQLDPENIESITILKDAAAASIWGSRAANGVLVVKTKKGAYNQPVNVSFVSSFNLSEKPDLFYRPKMSVSDYIDAQRLRFIRAGINLSVPTAATSVTVESEVAEIMNDYLNRKVITEAQANAQLDALRGNDVRRDISEYLLRSSFSQNYSLAVSGGSKGMAYRVSASYSDVKGNTVGAGSNRLVLGYNASVRPLKGLELSWNANYIRQHRDLQNGFTFVGTDYTQFQPYTRLADDQGNPLELFKYRRSFVQALQSAYGNRILDMTYKPLEEMNLGSVNAVIQGINLGLNALYRFSPSLSMNVAYSYNRQLTDEEIFTSKDSYYIRELTNRFTNRTTFGRALAYGDLLQPNRQEYTGQTLRAQLNFSHTWNKHALNAIAGVDGSQNYSLQSSNTYLGYDRDKLTFNNSVDIGFFYPYLYGAGGVTAAQLPYLQTLVDNRNRALSSYANAAYTYDNRYTVSGSVRRDGSSLYGVSENRGGTPFYSGGASWNLANEHFYHLDFLPRLQLRGTFGYNGNSNPAVFPVPRITFAASTGANGLPFGGVPTSTEATNNNLRPERTGVLNLGLDFGLKGGRISGSMEYYIKNTKDLISQNQLDPSTGFSQLQYNTGDLRGSGIDVTLNSLNLQRGKFSWTTNLLISSNRVKVKKLFIPGAVTATVVVTGGTTNSYTVGYDLDRLFAYRWAGLDPQTGNPRFFLNDQVLVIGDGTAGSTNGNAIRNALPSTARYMGSAVPVYFGSLRNSFSYGSLVVSANILYKLKYFTRRPQADLTYYTLLYESSQRLLGSEFSQRWQKPGDELITNVPSMSYPGNAFKDILYQYSDINVLKGDHIRLQEVNVSWGFKQAGWGLKNARVFANVTNLGILWRANRLGVDPDINDVPNPRTYSFGLSANF